MFAMFLKLFSTVCILKAIYGNNRKKNKFGCINRIYASIHFVLKYKCNLKHNHCTDARIQQRSKFSFYIYCREENMTKNVCLLRNFRKGLKERKFELELLLKKLLFGDKFTAPTTTFVQLQQITFDQLPASLSCDAYLSITPLYKA